MPESKTLRYPNARHLNQLYCGSEDNLTRVEQALAVPFRAATDLAELDTAERADLMDEIILGKEVLKAAINPNAFNVGFNLGAAAGGSIPHLHAHIVPRWNGDTNFMPVIGQTRVLPQSLAAMYARLKEVADKFPAKS